MQEIQQNGIKDADYIEISDAVIPSEFVHSAIQKTGDKDLIIFPILADNPEHNPDSGIYVVGWQQKKDAGCIQSKNCLEAGKRAVKGVVRKIKKRRDLSDKLSDLYQLPLAENPVFIEVGQAPMAWYWHLLVLILTAGGIILIETNRHQS